MNVFLGELSQLGIGRQYTDNFIFKKVADSWSSIDPAVQTYEPGNIWGKLVYQHGINGAKMRLPKGYHLTIGKDNAVYAHQDVFDGAESPISNLFHIMLEAYRPVEYR